MSKIGAAAFAALVLSSVPAMATAIISGDYIITFQRMCQPTLSVNFNQSNNVDGVNLNSPPNNQQSMLTATFSPSKGTVKVDGVQDQGSAFLLQLTGNQNGTQGEAMNEQPQSGKQNYTNTDTTFSVGDENYHAIFGQIDKKGITHAWAFQGLSQTDGGGSCSEQGQATLIK